MNYDSGRKRGYRKTKAGRTDVRSVLYMSTLVATRYNPLIRTQYQQLLKRGKVKKVALTAVCENSSRSLMRWCATSSLSASNYSCFSTE